MRRTKRPGRVDTVTVMVGNDCPNCDRRLEGPQCRCGWGVSPEPICTRCESADGDLVVAGAQALCWRCRAVVRQINAATDEDRTASGETVGQLRARVRAELAARWA